MRGRKVLRRAVMKAEPLPRGYSKTTPQEVQAIFCRLRHQPRRPPLAKIRPGKKEPRVGVRGAPGVKRGYRVLAGLFFAPRSSQPILRRLLQDFDEPATSSKRSAKVQGSGINIRFDTPLRQTFFGCHQKNFLDAPNRKRRGLFAKVQAGKCRGKVPA